MISVYVFLILVTFNLVFSDIGCIPTAGLGIVTDPQAFFPRLVQSIDFCIDNFVLVKTSFVNLTEGIHNLKNSEFIKNFTIIEQEKYIFSVSEGWNSVLKAFPDSVWYIIFAYDVELRPQQLELFSRRFWDHSKSHMGNLKPGSDHIENPLLLVFSNYENADVASCAYNIFGFTQRVLKDIGYFDENLFPAYWEDTDWQYRFDRYYGHNSSKIYYDIKNWHGIHGSTRHITGTTYLEKTFPNWAHVRHQGNVANKNYVRKKWGCNGKVTLETCAFSTPYGNPKLNIGDWTKDVNRIEGMRASLIPSSVQTSTTNIPNNNDTIQNSTQSRRLD